ncbi:hypothetical protein EYZ11_007951 [Aspergillus tanneri]|uniref:Uncharacterized protein n=1 Tax=Aspergillus tanneri TaxID=1220188 RepID=A0A4S3JBN6_9EURO|nr:hypothetical protein EYZ11_007951 [Aspergillus tanneri]
MAVNLIRATEDPHVNSRESNSEDSKPLSDFIH